MRADIFRGWYQIGFERELTEKLTPVRVDRLPLVLVRNGEGFRALTRHARTGGRTLLTADS